MTKSKKLTKENESEVEASAKSKEDDKKNVKSVFDLYDELMLTLHANNYYPIPDEQASGTSYHTLFCLTEPDELRGIEYPEDFKLLRMANELIYKKFANQYVNNDFSFGQIEAVDTFEFGLPLAFPKSGQASDLVHCFRALRQNEVSLFSNNVETYFKHGIAIRPSIVGETVQKDVRAFVPEKSWFSEELQELEFEDIIKIFPGADCTFIKLIYGRVCAGRDGNIHPHEETETEALARKDNSTYIDPEFIFNTTWRKACLISGAAGVGKSVTLTGLTEALSYLGYTSSPIGNVGRFGSDQIANSDLSFNDDLTLDSLKSLITSDIFKSLVSNTVVRVEQKGVDSYSVVPRCVIIANLNDMSSSQFLGLDTGVLDRIVPISTLTNPELRVLSVSIGEPTHPCQRIPYLAEKYDCDEETLYLRALRSCLDFFLEKNTTYKNIDQYCQELLPELRFQLTNNILQNFVRSMMLSYILMAENIEAVNPPEFHYGYLETMITATRIVMLDKDLKSLRDLIKQDWIEEKKSRTHVWNVARQTNLPSLDNAYKKLFLSTDEKNVETFSEILFGNYRNSEGHRLSGKTSAFFSRDFNLVKAEFEQLKQLALNIKNNVSPEIRAILDKGTSYVPNTDYLHRTDYNSALIDNL